MRSPGLRDNRSGTSTASIVYSVLIGLVLVIVVGFLFRIPNTVTTAPDTHGGPDACVDPIWCSIPMPTTSLMRGFPPPNDAIRWRRAQQQAASGELVLLKEIFPHFPNYMDFLDGDTSFRAYHRLSDVFLDKNHDFTAIFNSTVESMVPKTEVRGPKGSHFAELPVPYYAARMQRAPIVQLGYNRFRLEARADYFNGGKLEEKTYHRQLLIRDWNRNIHNITSPYILLSLLNENWGILSSIIPNRTATWVDCCTEGEYTRIQRILDHPQTLLFLTVQHSNFSHPKLLTLPRGVPNINHENRLRMWDLMRKSVQNGKKSTFVFSASSNWRHRPVIKQCLRDQFKGESGVEITGYEKVGDLLKGRMTELEYYEKLMNTRISIAIPGLGYDTYRLWESLTFGVLPVIERGVGLEKTLWKLPVLFVDDFAEVTPQLVRSAYVQALYYAKEFEFERLTQSFWFNLILDASSTQSNKKVLEKFPPEADEKNFVRPKVMFDCWKTNTCGKGTKQIPRRVC